MINLQLVLLACVAIFAVIGYFVWDRRYKGSRAGDFRPTQEVFTDPASGRRTRVYEDPATGKRQYREEPQS